MREDRVLYPRHHQLMIIGASGHGEVIADIAESTGYYQKILCFDDNLNKKGILGMPLSGTSADALQQIDSADVIIAIGNNHTRMKLQKQFEAAGATMVTLIHPSAVIGSHVSIGRGTVIMAGAIVNPGSVIDDGVILNTACSVDHDNHIFGYVHISVGAHLAGTVTIGEGTMIGAGAVVINNLTVGDWITIGAGAAVVKDLKEQGTYAGVPAHLLRRQKQ